MKLVYLDTCNNHKMVNAIASATVFETDEELKSYFRFEGYGIVDISAIGYKSKDICDDEIVEVWGVTGDDKRLLGKVIRVSDEKKFKKSILKWNKKNNDSYPEEFVKINTWIESM